MQLPYAAEHYEQDRATTHAPRRPHLWLLAFGNKRYSNLPANSHIYQGSRGRPKHVEASYAKAIRLPLVVTSIGLDLVLRDNDVQNVGVAGLLTNWCVEGTVRSSYEKGYNRYSL